MQRAVPAIPSQDIDDSLRALGAKVTLPRRRVLETLRRAPAPLSQRELIASLQARSGETLDRVTIYRVLDWLVEVGLANKAADSQGVFRFSAVAAPGVHDTHVHFRCVRCGGVFCLKEAPPAPPKLPRGFRLQQVSIDIRGECAACAGAAH